MSANKAILSPHVCPSANVPTAFYKCHRSDFFLRLFAHWPVCCIQMSFYTAVIMSYLHEYLDPVNIAMVPAFILGPPHIMYRVLTCTFG